MSKTKKIGKLRKVDKGREYDIFELRRRTRSESYVDRPHNPKVRGSNPLPATNFIKIKPNLVDSPQQLQF